MAANLRQDKILGLAKAEGRVSVDELAARFGVTAQTIRRDLGELAEAGKLARVHGGAVVPEGVANIGYHERRGLNAVAKAAIGQACAAAIPNNSSLFLNIGTTTEAVARALLGHRQLTVVTNNLNVANMDHAVIGTSALDLDGDLLDFDAQEVRVSRAIIRQARKVFLVADASKLTRAAPVRIASLSEIDALFTDRPLPESLAARCAEWGTEVRLASGIGTEA
ncbi:MAG: DeoR/GlpR family DNA-binding transcription regulator [Rhodobacteraceae bacterium]|nr:DeoR/GlpR family DNA-binding transcription regulator [Paracoccaceae bacterium]